MSASLHDSYKVALQWHLDAGADEALQDTPNDRTVSAVKIVKSSVSALRAPEPANAPDLMGAASAKAEAQKLAAVCKTLDELKTAIAAFEGLAIRKTATNLVFADGNPAARVMVIGEAPGADEDKIGKPFAGPNGLLLDKILKCINLSRTDEDPAKAAYLTNILNWRPPGGRTPTAAELDVSLPFIERHIALAQPDFVLLLGGVAAKALLGSGEAISKLRGKFTEYKPLTAGISERALTTAVATYHPSYLLANPSQKGLVWADMLMLQGALLGHIKT